MSDVITTNVDSSNNHVTEFDPEAFESQDIPNGYVPDHEVTAIAEIGQYVRSLMGEDTPECDVTVKRFELVNDTPFYNMDVSFSGQFPVILQTDIGNEWKINNMYHKESKTTVSLRYQGVTF